MKTSEAVEALKQGKIIIGIPSDSPVDKSDSCSTGRNCYRLYRGDKVVVELSPYDLSRGRIIYRVK